MNNIKIPKQIFKLSKLFNLHNFDLYLVGGSIRDCILGKIPNDFDFTTQARAENILEILKHYKTFTQGQKYGTIGVIFENIKCEITTFRIDGKYYDNRHPSEIIFHNDLYLDLKRRDFTINAIAYDLKCKTIIDKFDCIKSIKSKIIKCVGNEEERFREDSLRILRAFTFCSKLDFDISNETLEAIYNAKELIKNIKIERIRLEIQKILSGKNPKKALKLMKQYQILKIKQIPANINNVNKKYRIYLAFILFNTLQYLSPKARLKVIEIEKIFTQIIPSRNTKQTRLILAKLLSNHKKEDIKIVIEIKYSMNKKYKIYKKIFNNIGKIPTISGSKILDLKFNKMQIKQIKENLMIYGITNKIRDENILLHKIKFILKDFGYNR